MKYISRKSAFHIYRSAAYRDGEPTGQESLSGHEYHHPGEPAICGALEPDDFIYPYPASNFGPKGNGTPEAFAEHDGSCAVCADRLRANALIDPAVIRPDNEPTDYAERALAQEVPMLDRKSTDRAFIEKRGYAPVLGRHDEDDCNGSVYVNRVDTRGGKYSGHPACDRQDIYRVRTKCNRCGLKDRVAVRRSVFDAFGFDPLDAFLGDADADEYEVNGYAGIAEMPGSPGQDPESFNPKCMNCEKRHRDYDTYPRTFDFGDFTAKVAMRCNNCDTTNSSWVSPEDVAFLYEAGLLTETITGSEKEPFKGFDTI